jgi:hypothetical protein
MQRINRTLIAVPAHVPVAFSVVIDIYVHCWGMLMFVMCCMSTKERLSSLQESASSYHCTKDV